MARIISYFHQQCVLETKKYTHKPRVAFAKDKAIPVLYPVTCRTAWKSDMEKSLSKYVVCRGSLNAGIEICHLMEDVCAVRRPLVYVGDGRLMLHHVRDVLRLS